MERKLMDLLKVAVAAAEDRKAQNLVALDLQGLSAVTDCFVICSGSSDTNVRSIADSVQEKLKEAGQRPLGVEGYDDGTWILLDYVDFVFHIFHFDKRLTFSLEDLWKDAARLPLGEGDGKAKEGA